MKAAIGVVNRFEETLARIDAGAVIQPCDRETIRDALQNHINLVKFFLQGEEWVIGQQEYPNWIGYGHVSKLLQHPGEQVHVYDLTNQPNFENARR